MPADIQQRLKQIEAFNFKNIHPNLRFGTASDRYAGWIGQIYADAWQDKVKTRTKKLGSGSFKESVLPVESIGEYFDHFGVSELDFTFYRPLLDAEGKPTSSFFTLSEYADHAPADARFILKVPQQFFTPKIRRKAGWIENPDYLNANLYVDQFLTPAENLLGNKLTGVIFEQGYQRVKDSPSVAQLLDQWDTFFSKMPSGYTQPHIEMRSPHLLTPEWFSWLQESGIGYVFSHWTWLPSIMEQWKLSGGIFPAQNKEAIIRLLTPRRMKYADAYATAHPFDKAIPDLSESKQAIAMVNETTALGYQAIKNGVSLNIVANNRAWGNAPQLNQAVANRFMDFAEKNGA